MKQHPAPRNHISERSPAAGRMHLPGGYLLTENGEDTKGPEPLVYGTPAPVGFPTEEPEAQLTYVPL